jgi:hypothetical protein
MKTRLAFLVSFICLIFCGSFAFAEGIAELKAKAEKGDADSQFLLGGAYFSGEGVTKDDAKAVEWYRKAAEQGNADAQGTLGALYFTGNGVPKDSVEAVKWFRLAADQGHAWGQYNLGNMHNQGRSVTKDLEKAVKWYRLAADQGHPKAQFDLATCYEYGNGTAIDHFKAKQLYDKLIKDATLINQDDYSWDIIWGFVDDDIWIENTSSVDWTKLMLLEVTLVRKGTVVDELHKFLLVPNLKPGEKHMYEDVMSISSGSHDNIIRNANLYEVAEGVAG